MQDFSYTLLKGNSRVFNSILSLLKHPLKKNGSTEFQSNRYEFHQSINLFFIHS